MYKTIVILLCGLVSTQVEAQSGTCTFKPPIIKIDFGTAANVADWNFYSLAGYDRNNSSCPDDGQYAYVSSTPGCFDNDWFKLTEDHTPGDRNGNMMLVNASTNGGVFLILPLKGLAPNTKYELSQWMMNVCRIGGTCVPLPPDIRIRLRKPEGSLIATFETGLLPQTQTPKWRNYNGFFTTPVSVGTLILTMEDMTLGGCGNDFVLDDIVVRECVETQHQVDKKKPPTEVKTSPALEKPTSKLELQSQFPKQQPAEQRKVEQPKVEPAVKKQVQQVAQRQPQALQQIPRPTTPKPLPLAVSLRATPLVKKFNFQKGEVSIELFDNGSIDGDTVSVYHNNQLIISRAAISSEPLKAKLYLDESQPHHELVMVAENLGSIPPNTSLMVLKINGETHEVFISSSQERNAKIVIDLK
jgi:hypothetical protein